MSSIELKVRIILRKRAKSIYRGTGGITEDKALSQILALLPKAPAMLTSKELWEIISKVDYPVDEYEVRGDDGDYSPNEQERFLIKDYLQGFLDELVPALEGKIPVDPRIHHLETQLFIARKEIAELKSKDVPMEFKGKASDNVEEKKCNCGSLLYENCKSCPIHGN